MDRKLLWSVTTLLAFASVAFIASTLGRMIRHIRRGAVQPNSDAFGGLRIATSGGGFWEKDGGNINHSTLNSYSNYSNNDTRQEIPNNLVFVTDRLPGDAKIDPHTLQNAALWQEMYKGEKYKMHFFPGSDSIIKFFESEAPHLLPSLKNCETLYEEFDFARYVILYYLGGISVDIAVTRPLDRLDTLLKDLNPKSNKQQIVAAVDYDFSNNDDSKLWAYPRPQGLGTHVWAATPRHPILLKVIEQVSANLLDRDSVDKQILEYGYPSSVLQQAQKAKLLRRTWTTGSGPFSDVLLQAVKDQKRNNNINHQVIILPMETFMSTHPGGMRFRNIQHSRDHSHLIYMGEEDNDATNIDHEEANINAQRRNKIKRSNLASTTQISSGNIREPIADKSTAADARYVSEGSQPHEHGGSPANLNPKQQKRQQPKAGTTNNLAAQTATDLRWKNYLVYDESHLPEDTHHAISPYTYLIGAVRDASQIADTPFEYIVQLSCEHGVHVHIVVGGGVEECRTRFESLVQEKYSLSKSKCGRFELLGEPNDLHSLDNRVDRIAYLRDFQREHLRVVLENGDKDDIIVVADIDLYALPPVSKLMREVNRMRQLHEYDVLCSNGLMHRPNGYYDIYATVLLPDTFLYPVRHRLLGKSWEGEDLTLVRSHDEFGEVTSWDILDWIERQGEKKRKENAELHQNQNSVIEVKQDNLLWTKAKAIGTYSEGNPFLVGTKAKFRLLSFNNLTLFRSLSPRFSFLHRTRF